MKTKHVVRLMGILIIMATLVSCNVPPGWFHDFGHSLKKMVLHYNEIQMYVASRPYVIERESIEYRRQKLYEKSLMNLVIKYAESGMEFDAIDYQQRNDIIAVAKRMGYHGQYCGLRIRLWRQNSPSNVTGKGAIQI